MKKYWKFTALMAFIMLSMGAFYVNAALSAVENPEFILKTISGDKQEIEALVLEGSYGDISTRNYGRTELQITVDGSEYNNHSFLDKVIGNPPEIIKGLRDKYKNFMRAKGQSVNSYFENEQFLAYVEANYDISSYGTSNFRFTIDVLDKTDDNRTSFTINVPESSKTDHIMVEDIQMIDNELILITQNFIRDEQDFYNEKRMYTIDVENKDVSSHETIFSSPEGEVGKRTEAILIESSPLQAKEDILFLTREFQVSEKEEPSTPEDSKVELISYDLATKEKTVIHLPESLDINDSNVNFFDGTTIYFTKFEGDKYVITPYHVKKNEVGKTIPLPNMAGEMMLPMTTVKNGKLYAISPDMNAARNAKVVVIDVKTGDTLYEGEVVLEGSDVDEFELYLYDMFVK